MVVKKCLPSSSAFCASGLIIILHILTCPYNKVEESFNMQAIHDILYHKINVSQYDHIEFPGPVPRTFLGPMAVSLPCLFLCSIVPKIILPLFVRALLGFLFLHATNKLGSVFGNRLHSSFSAKFLMVNCTQFHLTFYATRTLPNTFALLLVIYSLVFLLRGSDIPFIIFAGFAILDFRSELLLFYGPLLIFGLYFGFVRIRPALIKVGFITVALSLALTVVVDSYFWQRWLWPEGEVFYFNAIENKSHLWGTKPFYWYFLIALPKSLMATAGLVLCANLVIVLPSSQSESVSRGGYVLLGLQIVALVFIGLYSFLPHKEFRFIIYSIPIFNLVATYLWDTIEHRLSMCLDKRKIREISKPRTKGPLNRDGSLTPALVHWIYRLGVSMCYFSLILNLCLSVGLLFISSHNYPGGEAITRLNNWPGLKGRRDVHVYVSNLAAQSGVNRFQQVNSHWIYNKTEKIDDDVQKLIQGPFTHFILEASKDTLIMRPEYFRQLFTVESFSGITYNPGNYFWNKLKISFTPSLVVYERVGLLRHIP